MTSTKAKREHQESATSRSGVEGRDREPGEPELHRVQQRDPEQERRPRRRARSRRAPACRPRSLRRAVAPGRLAASPPRPVHVPRGRALPNAAPGGSRLAAGRAPSLRSARPPTQEQHPCRSPPSAPPTRPRPSAARPYNQAIVADGFVFVAGQVALEPGGSALVEDGVTGQAEQVFDNLAAILEAAGSSLAEHGQGDGLPLRHGELRGRQRGLRDAHAGAVPGPLGVRGEGAADGRRWSRSRSSPRLERGPRRSARPRRRARGPADACCGRGRGGGRPARACTSSAAPSATCCSGGPRTTRTSWWRATAWRSRARSRRRSAAESSSTAPFGTAEVRRAGARARRRHGAARALPRAGRAAGRRAGRPGRRPRAPRLHGQRDGGAARARSARRAARPARRPGRPRGRPACACCMPRASSTTRRASCGRRATRRAWSCALEDGTAALARAAAPAIWTRRRRPPAPTRWCCSRPRTARPRRSANCTTLGVLEAIAPGLDGRRRHEGAHRQVGRPARAPRAATCRPGAAGSGLAARGLERAGRSTCCSAG